MADVSHLDATSRTIVGWQVASQMTVLRALEVARLGRGAFHGGLSFSLDRAHSDAGREGGFNRSSQHLVMMEVFDGSWWQAAGGGADRCEAAVDSGSGVACADAFPGTARVSPASVKTSHGRELSSRDL